MHLDDRSMSPLVRLTWSGGDLPSEPKCPSFTLSWSWSRLESSNGEFVGAADCREATKDPVTTVGVSLEFPPGTWDEQSVTVSHLGVKDVPIQNHGASTEFRGLDPAGPWTVLWAGNVQIHPIGIQLRVETD